MFKLNWGKLVFSTLFILAILVVFIFQSNRAEAQVSWFSGSATTGYRATISVGQILIWDSTCQQITNSNASSINYFIPTKTQAEWTAFRAVASLFTISITSCTPTSCLPGYYVNATVCTICPPGSYCTGEVAISGTCAAGYYCPEGSSSATPAAYACLAGTANSSTGQSAVGACASCAAGTYNSGPGNASCSACGCGYWCSGGTNHTACGANYWNANTNSSAIGACTYCDDNHSSPVGSCAVGNCAIRTCADSTTNDYSYTAINWGGTQAVSKAVTNGTCSATASCSAGTVSVTGESASCNSGWYNNDGACSNGCESKCGDGVCNNGETTGTCPGDCGCSPGATRTMYAALTNPSCGTYSASEVQTCQAGTYTFNGTYALASPPTASTRTRYAPATSTCGTYGSLSEGQTCTSGGWSGSYSLTSPPSAATRTMYVASTSNCGIYSYNSEGQTCQSNGAWTGSYILGSAPSAATRTGYTAASVNCSSSCTTQPQTCTSGGWNGTGVGACAPVTCSGGTPYCVGGSCVACTAASQCGTDGWEGATSCSGANIMQNYRTWSCNSNTCGSSVSSTVNSTCSGGTPYCVSGSCVACTAASQCGTDGWEGATSCGGSTIMQNYRTYSCNSNTCGSSVSSTANSTCSGGTPYCVGGSCVACTAASQCGTNGFTGSDFCSGTNLSGTYRTWSCNSNTCSYSDATQTKQVCGSSAYCYDRYGPATCFSCPPNTVNSFGGNTINDCTCQSRGMYSNSLETCAGHPSCWIWDVYYNCNNLISDGCEAYRWCNSGVSGDCPASFAQVCGYCGDGTCAGAAFNETAYNCSADCAICGDGICSGTESCSGCPADCTCSCFSDAGCGSWGTCEGTSGYCSDPCAYQTDFPSCEMCGGNWAVYMYGTCYYGS